MESEVNFTDELEFLVAVLQLFDLVVRCEEQQDVRDVIGRVVVVGRVKLHLHSLNVEIVTPEHNALRDRVALNELYLHESVHTDFVLLDEVNVPARTPLHRLFDHTLSALDPLKAGRVLLVLIRVKNVDLVITLENEHHLVSSIALPNKNRGSSDLVRADVLTVHVILLLSEINAATH